MAPTDESLTVVSTTDSQEEVNAAAGIEEQIPAGGEQPGGAEEPGEEQVPSGEEPGAGTQGHEPEPGEQQRTEAGGEQRRGRNSFQKRIDKLTGRNKRLEAELREERTARAQERAGLERRLTALEAGAPGKTTQPNAGTEPSADAGKPRLEQFDTLEQYVEAMGDWKAKQLRADGERERAAELQQQQQQESQQIFDDYVERADEARGRYADFDEVVGQPIKLPEGVTLSIMEMDNGPDVAYYLGKHPEICEELCEMTPISGILLAGEISREVAGGTASPSSRDRASGSGAGARTISRVQPPIKPVTTGGTGDASPDVERMSMAEYRRRREEGRI